LITAITFLASIGTVFASGQNQYASGFPASSEGTCHGAFANTNGDFGFLGPLGGSPGYHDGAVGQEPGATGYNNGAVAGSCS